MESMYLCQNACIRCRVVSHSADELAHVGDVSTSGDCITTDAHMDGDVYITVAAVLMVLHSLPACQKHVLFKNGKRANVVTAPPGSGKRAMTTSQHLPPWA